MIVGVTLALCAAAAALVARRQRQKRKSEAAEHVGRQGGTISTRANPTFSKDTDSNFAPAPGVYATMDETQSDQGEPAVDQK